MRDGDVGLIIGIVVKGVSARCIDFTARLAGGTILGIDVYLLLVPDHEFVALVCGKVKGI
jgi:hypothetical protein